MRMQVEIITPDKDLGQCVRGTRVVQYDRRKREIIDEQGVRQKFGVGPASIPDYLGLVGDTADGFPGLPGWGAKSTSLVLARYEHLENIPVEASLWEVDDRATTVLMRRFYRHLADTDAASALARAQRELLAGGGELARPINWASFELYGAAR